MLGPMLRGTIAQSAVVLPLTLMGTFTASLTGGGTVDTTSVGAGTGDLCVVLMGMRTTSNTNMTARANGSTNMDEVNDSRSTGSPTAEGALAYAILDGTYNDDIVFSDGGDGGEMNVVIAFFAAASLSGFPTGIGSSTATGGTIATHPATAPSGVAQYFNGVAWAQDTSTAPGLTAPAGTILLGSQESALLGVALCAAPTAIYEEIDFGNYGGSLGGTNPTYVTQTFFQEAA